MKQIETDHFYNYYQHLMTNNILKQIKHVRFITLQHYYPADKLQNSLVKSKDVQM